MTGASALERHATALAWASEWAQRWFLDEDGEDRFSVRGYDAGWATHVEAFLLLRDLAAVALGSQGRGRASMTRWLKSRGADRQVRSLLLRFSPRGADPGGPYAAGAVIEIPTPSMAEPAAIVLEEAGQSGVAGIADHRVARMLRGRRVGGQPLVLPWGDERRVVAESRTSLRRGWDEFVAGAPPMRLGEVDLTRSAIDRLARLVHRSMPYLAAESLAVERWIERTEIRGVAIASDQHRIGRLVVQAARAHGVRSVVLQHGLPQARIGYLPVVADVVAAWSHASRDWFLEAGADPDRVRVTGNPRISATRSGHGGQPGRADVLLPLSPTATATNVRLVEDVCRAVRVVQEATLTIKLHPGQSDWSFVAPIVRRAGLDGRVRVTRHEPLEPILEATRVVVVHRSTVALDAIAARRPVVAYRAGTETTTAETELAALRLPVATNPEGLASAIRQYAGAEASAAYFEDRAVEIARAVGPREGNARRILDLMLEAATPSDR